MSLKEVGLPDDDDSRAGLATPAMSLVYVFFLTTLRSGVANLSLPSFGYIFRKAGGVCTLGIRDRVSALFGVNVPPVLVADGPETVVPLLTPVVGMLLEPPELLNLGMRLFFSAP